MYQQQNREVDFEDLSNLTDFELIEIEVKKRRLLQTLNPFNKEHKFVSAFINAGKEVGNIKNPFLLDIFKKALLGEEFQLTEKQAEAGLHALEDCKKAYKLVARIYALAKQGKSNDFLESLASQFEDRGGLSPKQISGGFKTVVYMENNG